MIAGAAGIKKFLILVTGNIEMWHHPKYYKELRKRNRDLSELQRVKPERSVPKSDQAISLTLADGCNGSVRPGPGLKPQAASSLELETFP